MLILLKKLQMLQWYSKITKFKAQKFIKIRIQCTEQIFTNFFYKKVCTTVFFLTTAEKHIIIVLPVDRVSFIYISPRWTNNETGLT